MRIILIALTPLLVTACVASPDSNALCVGTLDARQSHAVALLEDAGPLSLDTGERLLTRLAAGCQE